MFILQPFRFALKECDATFDDMWLNDLYTYVRHQFIFIFIRDSPVIPIYYYLNVKFGIDHSDVFFFLLNPHACEAFKNTWRFILYKKMNR